MDPNNAGIRPEALQAWLRLCDAQDENPAYPCLNNPFYYMDYDGDEDTHSIITLDDADALCYGCPIMKQCYDFAVANKEQHGVWGGIVFGIEDKLF